MAKVECYKCNGTGMMYCPINYSSTNHPNSCASCSGNDKVRCLVCDGTGEIEEE